MQPSKIITFGQIHIYWVAVSLNKSEFHFVLYVLNSLQNIIDKKLF